MSRLSGKAVVVTGGAGGIGTVISTLLAQEGARVLVADIDGEGAQAQAEKLRADGLVAEACSVDLGDEESVRKMMETATAQFGGIDALVNNAGDTGRAARDGGIEHMDTAFWDDTMRINLRGTMLACKFAIPVLRAQGGGAIVNISSGAALRGALYVSAYAASKAAIITLSQYVAAQHGHEGIRCNAIAPGVIMTGGTAKSFGPVEDAVLQQHLSTRLGRPMDIAWTVLWLVADEGAFVNGQCIAVDGGVTSHQRFWMDLPMTAGGASSRDASSS